MTSWPLTHMSADTWWIRAQMRFHLHCSVQTLEVVCLELLYSKRCTALESHDRPLQHRMRELRATRYPSRGPFIHGAEPSASRSRRVRLRMRLINMC